MCTFTHVLPLSMVVCWNVLFFSTWLAMHIMYLVILGVAMQHRKMIRTQAQAIPRSVSNQSNSSSSGDGGGGERRTNLTPVEGGRRSSAVALAQRIRSLSVAALSRDRARVKTTFKTVRYIVLLLFIYSLVELPVVTVAIDDLLSHRDSLYERYYPYKDSYSFHFNRS